MYSWVMNAELHKILLEMEYKFHDETKDYFKWSEERKEALIGEIVDCFIPTINQNPHLIPNIIIGLDRTVEQAVSEEEYEHAEILRRVRNVFIKMIF